MYVLLELHAFTVTKHNKVKCFKIYKYISTSTKSNKALQYPALAPMGSCRNTCVVFISLFWTPSLALCIIIFEKWGLTSNGVMDRVPPWKPLRSLRYSGDVWIAGLSGQDLSCRETRVPGLTRFLL